MRAFFNGRFDVERPARLRQVIQPRSPCFAVAKLLAPVPSARLWLHYLQ